MSPLIEKLWSRYTWASNGNSDEDSESEREVSDEDSEFEREVSDEDSESEWEDSAEASTTMPDLELTNVSLDHPAASHILELKFERYENNHLSPKNVRDNIFNLIKKPLKQSKNPTEGYIYALSIENHPGYIKIGHTRVSIESRLKAIGKCIPYKLRLYDDNDYYRIPNYRRLEMLIHAELHNERRKFDCRCGEKATGNDGLKTHGEWFAISETEASVVINRWRKWMSTDPYSGKVLRATEQLKIDYYNGRTDFRWSDFMDFPRLKLQYLWLHNELHRPRPEKLNCSRWDSLCKHWGSNLVFYVAYFIFSYALFVVSAILPSALISIGYFAFVNSTFLGSLAIWYAA